MQWKDLGKIVGEYAPMLGDLLPIPGAGIAGKLIANVLGVANTPDAIHDAIKADPQAALKLAKLELDNKALIQQQLLTAETSRILAVNATMQGEAKSEHWAQWLWRPYWGFISGTAFFIVSLFVCYLAYRGIIGGDASAIPMIPQLVGSFAALFAIPMSILGVASWHRGAAKVARIKQNSYSTNGD